MPRLKELLAEGRAVRVFAAGQLISPKLIQVAGEHGGFDALWLDAEHAGITMRDVELATLAARPYGMDSFVRLPPTDYASVMRPLEAGAGGLMFSMVQSAAQAEQAVRWAKFFPRGERGLNGGNRDGRFGLTPIPEYIAAANASTFLGVQVETAGALAEAAAIAAIPGVDLLFVGPSDLSQVLGVPGDFENPRCLEAIAGIARACEAAGKPWGVWSRGPEYAERMRSMGCRLFVLAADIQMVHLGIRAAKQWYPGFFPAS
ncbi:2-keto-3-deoxy-L-rhamnonate aldolase [Aquisphaera giovannonii]|uniref:2-keto-3-deoxy-L-rhamnonate aldolase n=1 Tax=Aquisphaera giovannonii TaxID=406548 RepID=A0A5B9W6U8_9BACT|nr:aldolase/citrate lyase family protein [Aquisphaera giovannonii]QEH36333.1 2-keto-3-deoxy-L-rhamnonate aldolase [Aquisphaera giovannonii]